MHPTSFAASFSIVWKYARIVGSVVPMPYAESQHTLSVRTNCGIGGAHAVREATARTERTYEFSGAHAVRGSIAYAERNCEL